MIPHVTDLGFHTTSGGECFSTLTGIQQLRQRLIWAPIGFLSWLFVYILTFCVISKFSKKAAYYQLYHSLEYSHWTLWLRKKLIQCWNNIETTLKQRCQRWINIVVFSGLHSDHIKKNSLTLMLVNVKKPLNCHMLLLTPNSTIYSSYWHQNTNLVHTGSYKICIKSTCLTT